VTVDGQDLGLAESATTSLAVLATTTGAHDRATLTFGPGSPALDASPAASVAVALGYGSDLEAVFTGTVARVAHQPWGTEVTALAATSALEGVRVGRAYVGRTVGDIVRDLAGEAGVSPGEVEAGPTLPVFYVDEARSAWRHVRNLARLTAAELSSAPDGGLHLRPPRAGTADHRLRAGAELLAWAVGGQSELAPAPGSGPYSAASEQGTEAWSLVHHDPGGSGSHRVHPLLRDRDTCQLVDEATTKARSRAGRTGTAVVVGDPAIRAGDLVELRSVERAEDTYRVVSARHEIGPDGFRTTLRLEGVAG
jgi:phage protein D